MPLGLECTARNRAFLGPDGQIGWQTVCASGVAPQVALKPGGAPAMLRVNAVTDGTLGISHFVEVTTAGKVSLPFGSFAQGAWVTNRTPLDTSRLTSLEFHVFTNPMTQTPFGFCVSNVRFLHETLVGP